MSEYWGDCIKEAFEDAGIVATKEQIDTVIVWVEGCDENRSLGTGSDAIPNPLEGENKRLKRELDTAKKQTDDIGRLKEDLEHKADRVSSLERRIRELQDDGD